MQYYTKLEYHIEGYDKQTFIDVNEVMFAEFQEIKRKDNTEPRSICILDIAFKSGKVLKLQGVIAQIIWKKIQNLSQQLVKINRDNLVDYIT